MGSEDCSQLRKGEQKSSMWRTVQLNMQSYEIWWPPVLTVWPLEGGWCSLYISSFIVLLGVCCCLILKGSLSFEARSHCVTQAGLKLLGSSDPLSPSPGSWDYRHALPIHLDWTFKIFFFLMCVQTSWVPGSLGTGVTGGYKLPSVGTKNQSQVFCKSSKHP